MKFKLYYLSLISVCLTLLSFSQPAHSNQVELLHAGQLRIEKSSVSSTLPLLAVKPKQAAALDAMVPAAVPPVARGGSFRQASILEETLEADTAQARLLKFIETVKDERKKGLVVGAFSASILAAPVVQQPADNMLYVSTREDTLTQFRRAQQAGVIGLLAHNYLAGAQFFNLHTGSKIYLINGDGGYRAFEVYAIEDYQALTLTTFRDLSTGKAVGQYPLFDRIYRSKVDRLVLQTCIEKNGSLSWGRRFILARPLPAGG